MDVRDRNVVVTGGANGIGAALCRRFAAKGGSVVVADLDWENAGRIAQEIDGIAVSCDVSDPHDVAALVETAERELGSIDVFCANAGITAKGGLEVLDGDWQRTWDVNVMSLVHASRAAIPGMIERGGGSFVVTASAAGLLTEIGSAPYSVTKHAAVAFAEWLAVQYHADGLHVGCICPMGVATEFLDEADPIHQFLAVTSITAEDVADSVIAGLADERFLILPHPDVAEFFARKAADFERYLKGFRRLKQKLSRRAA